MRRILVPTDFSAPARHATDLAMRFAQRHGAHVHLFHAVDVPDGFSEGRFSTAGLATKPARSQQELYPEARKRVGQARQRMEELSMELGKKKVKNTYDIGYNMAWRDVTRIAKDQDMDLIVMGTTGAGGMKEAMMGSNAQRIVRLATCPVITLRHAAPAKVANAVLVVDLTERGALQRVARLIDRIVSMGAKLHLLHVNTPVRFEDTDTSLERLHEAAKRIEPACQVHVTDHYTVAEGAIAFTRRAGMDLIALATHGRQGLRGLLNASVAETIVNHSEVPVLTDHGTKA